MNLWDTIKGVFTDFTGAWDGFLTGGANKTNSEMNAANIESQEKMNAANIESQEKMNAMNALNAYLMNQASLANQTDINNKNLMAQAYANQQNINLTREQNAANRAMQTDINAANVASQERMNAASLANQTDINNANIAMQRETNAQNLALQKEQWAREDSNYARTIKDMQSVGMSPLAMQGLNTTGGTMQMTAPQASASAQFGSAKQEAVRDERAQINAAEFKDTLKLQRAEMKAYQAVAPQAKFGAIAAGMADVAMDAIGKGIQAKQMKDNMTIREQELDIRKTENATRQIQAESALAETIRHNKVMENNGDWKNRIMNKVMDTLIGSDANGGNAITTGANRAKEAAEQVKNSTGGKALESLGNTLTGMATGNNEMKEKGYKQAIDLGTKVGDGIENAWTKFKGLFKRRK